MCARELRFVYVMFHVVTVLITKKLPNNSDKVPYSRFFVRFVLFTHVAKIILQSGYDFEKNRNG